MNPETVDLLVHGERTAGPAFWLHMKQRTRFDEGLDGLLEEIAQDFGPLRRQNAHGFRLALNEARALAWTSDVPQLVLPVLAREKLETLIMRQTMQERIRAASARILTMVA